MKICVFSPGYAIVLAVRRGDAGRPMIVKRKRAKLANELLDALEHAKAELEIAKKLYSQVLCECGETSTDAHERGAQIRAAFLASRRRLRSALKAFGRASKKGQVPEQPARNVVQASEESRQYAASSFPTPRRFSRTPPGSADAQRPWICLRQRCGLALLARSLPESFLRGYATQAGCNRLRRTHLCARDQRYGFWTSRNRRAASQLVRQSGKRLHNAGPDVTQPGRIRALALAHDASLRIGRRSDRIGCFVIEFAGSPRAIAALK